MLVLDQAFQLCLTGQQADFYAHDHQGPGPSETIAETGIVLFGGGQPLRTTAPAGPDNKVMVFFRVPMMVTKGQPADHAGSKPDNALVKVIVSGNS